MNIPSFERYKTFFNRLLSRKLKALGRAKEKACSHLNNCMQWEKVYHEAQLLQANLYRIPRGSSHFSVQDWEKENQEVTLVLDPLEEPHRQVASWFRRSKKLRLGIPHWTTRVERMQALYCHHEQLLDQLTKTTCSEELLPFQSIIEPKKSTSQNKPVETKVKLPYKEFISGEGVKIWVGRNAKHNEALTFRYANGLDYWLHVRDVPGSHVIIRVDKGKQPDEESLKDAMQLALAFSKSPEEGEVCITQCKYVTRQGKKAGTVHVSKHKIVYVKKEEIRLKRLRSSPNG